MPQPLSFNIPMRVHSIGLPAETSFRMVLLILGLCSSTVFADAVTDYNLAVQFYKQERWKLAAEACEDFVKNYPEHAQVPMAQLYWGQSMVHLREFDKARQRFKIYLSDPRATTDRALAMYRVGESSYFLNDFQSAQMELSEFLDKYGDHELAEWAVVYLAHSQFQLNDIEGSIKSFEKSLKEFENGKLTGEVEYGLARAYEVNGQAEPALGLYRKIANQIENPQASNAQFHLAAIQFSQGKFAEADLEFQALIKQYPKDRLAPLAALNSGYANYQLQKYDVAIERFRQAAGAESQKLTGNYWMGLSHKGLGDYQQASKIFTELLVTASDQPLAENIMFQAGDTELRLKNYPQAVNYFQKVYQKWPDGKYGDDALHSACEASLQAGDLAQAERFHQEFQKLYSQSGLSQVQDLLYGRVLISMGDLKSKTAEQKEAFYRQAVELLQNVLKQTTVEATQRFASFQLARTYERLGEDSELITILQPLLDAGGVMDQLTVDSLLLIANAKLRQEQYQAAITDYAQFLKRAQTTDLKLAGYAGLITAQISEKDWDQITASLQTLKTIDPDNIHYGRLCLAAGDAAFDLEEWKIAESLFRLGSALELGNDYFLAALSGLGHSLYKQELFAEAAATFGTLSQSAFTDSQLGAHSWYMLGMAKRQTNDSSGALAAYLSGLQKYNVEIGQQSPELQETVYRTAKGAARVARDLNDLPQSDALYQQALNLSEILPDRSDEELDKLLFEWADMHYNAEDYQRADDLFARLVKMKPNSSLADDAGLILAESLRFSGKNEDAEKAFRKLATSQTSDDFVRQRAYIHLVDLGAEQKKWEQVLSDSSALQNVSPQNEHELYLKYRSAEALLQTQQIQKANQLLDELRAEMLTQTAATTPPWWEAVWLLQGECFLQLKDYTKLSEVIEDLRNRSPESKVIHRGDLLLGRSHENQAKFEEARAAYTRVIDSKSGNGTETAAEAQFRIAESYLKQNNFETALKEYYKVYAGYDAPAFEAAALYQAGRSDAKMKSWKGAVQTFRILLQEFPESEYVTDAKKQLVEIEAAFPELKRESP